jgi:hypothetical protein
MALRAWHVSQASALRAEAGGTAAGTTPMLTGALGLPAPWRELGK